MSWKLLTLGIFLLKEERGLVSRILFLDNDLSMRSHYDRDKE